MGIKIDDDLWKQAIESATKSNAMVVGLLLQILREIKKEGPEEKSASVKGFTI